MEPSEWVLSAWKLYDDYFAQKERLAYSVTTLYILGASILIVHEPFWLKYPLYGAPFFIFLFGATALTVHVINWQLQNREFAGYMSEACSNLASTWLTNPPDIESLKTEEFLGLPEPANKRFRGLLWAKVVVKEFKEVAKNRSPGI